VSRAARLVVLHAIGLIAVCVASAANAQPAPWRRWRTLDTPHFRVHVDRGLEDVGRRAAAAAEVAYAKLARELAPPRGTIDLVVSDDADYSNGFAVVSPTNRIVVFATPPIEHAGLRFNEDWLELVITHELTHVFHLDRTRGAWRVAQTLFGRAPSLFPNAYGPSWLVEGLAVYEESRLTHGGRLNDAQHRLYARAGAIEGKLFRLDELSLGTSRFPAERARTATARCSWTGSRAREATPRSDTSSMRRLHSSSLTGSIPQRSAPSAPRSARRTAHGATR
jgi:hypothetical protein